MARAGKKIAISSLLAAAAGYLAGILTAPKSGKETRQDIADSAVKVKAEAEDQLKKLSSELKDLINDGQKKSKELTESAKVELNKALDKAETTREKAREILSAFHEGQSSDDDLNNAVKNVTDAIGELKAFIKK